MADPALLAEFRRPFRQQLAALRLRLERLVPTARWDDLWQAEHDRAFVVAGAQKADLLADLAGAVDKAVSKGTTLDEFRRDFREIVERRGWHGWTGEGTARGEAWRTRVIYRTNVATSYAAGRRAQLIEGDFAWWVYRHGGSREPRPHHLALDGIALPPDHPFWAKHFPPNDWGCSCRVFGARSEAGIRRVGGDPSKRLPEGWDRIDPRTGAPVGIGRGWAYAPGASVADDIIRLAREKAERLPAQLRFSFLEAFDRPESEAAEAEQVLALLDVLAAQFGRAGGGFAQFVRANAAAADEPRLRLAERMAVNAYTHPEIYAPLNRALRSGAALSDEARRYVDLLDRALARLSAFEGRTRRGIEMSGQALVDFAGRMREGELVEFRGFTSTSVTRPMAGEVVVTVHGRSGRAVSHLSAFPTEEEVLFPRGVQFRVRSAIFDGDELRLVLDEVAPGERQVLTGRSLNAEALG